MDPRIEVELARRFLVDGWMSFKKMTGDTWGVEQNHHDGKSSPAVWHSLPDRILAAAPHLQGISGHERRLDELLQTMPLLEALEIIDREFG
jgi:hypothetical protein